MRSAFCGRTHAEIRERLTNSGYNFLKILLSPIQSIRILNQKVRYPVRHRVRYWVRYQVRFKFSWDREPFFEFRLISVTPRWHSTDRVPNASCWSTSHRTLVISSRFAQELALKKIARLSDKKGKTAYYTSSLDSISTESMRGRILAPCRNCQRQLQIRPQRNEFSYFFDTIQLNFN